MRRLPVSLLAMMVGAASAVPVGIPSASSGAVATSVGHEERPVIVMTLGDFKTAQSDNSEWADAVRARFRIVNRSGGIADATGRHRRVEVVTCNSAADADRSVACALGAVRMHVAAVVGMAAAFSDRVWPILQTAGIPVIGPRVTSLADAQSPVSFPLGPGVPGIFNAMPALLAREGATRVGVVISDYGPESDDAVTFLQNGMASSRVSEGPIIRVAPGNPDLVAAAAAMRSAQVDGVVGFVSGGHEGQLIEQLRLAGVRAKYVTGVPFGATPLASDISYDTNGALAVGEFALSTSREPGIQQYRRDLMRYRGLPSSQGALNFWLAAWVFGRVASDLPTIRAAGVLEAMSNLDHLDTGGVTPPLTTRNPKPDLPRLFNSGVTFNEVRHGQLVPLSPGFYDPFAGV
jgi:ABC-type branched-subunit amino acid transport system substrate-binding protein